MIARLRRVILARVSGPSGDTERGSVLVWFVLSAPVLLLLAVLLVDGGAKIKAGEQAGSYSAEAARAAAIAVGPHPAGGTVDTRAAVSAANGYLSAAGVRGIATVTGPGTVTVSVTVSRTGPVSGVTFTATRSATARLLVGVEKGETP
jgi:Flp pilus assembly protein TadG